MTVREKRLMLGLGLLAALSVSFQVAGALVGCEALGVGGVSLETDPATGGVGAVLWWCPETGECTDRPRPGAVRVFVPLPRTEDPPTPDE